jgi:uncharacterized protein (TIGR02246 family)
MQAITSMSRTSLVAAALVTAGCSADGAAHWSEDRQAASAAVAEHLTDLAESMEARDAERVMSHFTRDSAFLVVTDGMVYPSFDSLYADVRRGYGMFSEVEMEWTSLDVAILSDGVAAVTASYEQRTMMNDGNPRNMNGMWTGVLVRTDGMWRIVRVQQQTTP